MVTHAAETPPSPQMAYRGAMGDAVACDPRAGRWGAWPPRAGAHVATTTGISSEPSARALRARCSTDWT